jgi:hypothetical protein
MTEAIMQQLHVDLGFAFSLYVTEHLDWPLLEQLPLGTMLVFQTDDPDYNAWELQSAVKSRQSDDEPDRPITLIYVRVPDPPGVKGIAWDQAKVLASFAIKADYKKLAATA